MANPNQGWVKLHRKFQDWEWADNPNMVCLFVHLLLMANHEEGRWHGITVKPGQLIAGRKKLAEVTGISEQTIRTCLNTLKSTNELTLKSTNKFSLITIVKWEEYQGNDDKPTSKSTSTLTNNQPTTNHKQECKECKKKEYIATPTASPSPRVKKPSDDNEPMTLTDFKAWCEKSNQPHINFIGEWADTVKPDCRTKGQWREYISRNVRPAKRVIVFQPEQIERAYNRIEEDRAKSKNGFLERFTIETLEKYLIA